METKPMAEPAKDLVVKDRIRVPAGQARRPGKTPENFLAVIMAAATDPRCDVQKMQALLVMQREVEDRESQKEFNRNFILLQEELPAIARDGKIEIFAKDATGARPAVGRAQQSTPYATFNNIMKTIKPLLIRYGFALSFSTEPVGERLLVKGLLEGHGHARTTSFPLPAETSGSKNNVQGWGSSMSYGKRYATIALLNIISDAKEDVDADGHGGNFERAKGGGFAEVPAKQKPVSPAQRDDLIQRITDAKITESQFCTRYGVLQIGLLPAELYDAAVKSIEDHVEAAREQRAQRRG
jgi:hypothetical protein